MSCFFNIFRDGCEQGTSAVNLLNQAAEHKLLPKSNGNPFTEKLRHILVSAKVCQWHGVHVCGVQLKTAASVGLTSSKQVSLRSKTAALHKSTNGLIFVVNW